MIRNCQGNKRLGARLCPRQRVHWWQPFHWDWGCRLEVGWPRVVIQGNERVLFVWMWRGGGGFGSRHRHSSELGDKERSGLERIGANTRVWREREGESWGKHETMKKRWRVSQNSPSSPDQGESHEIQTQRICYHYNGIVWLKVSPHELVESIRHVVSMSSTHQLFAHICKGQ